MHSPGLVEVDLDALARNYQRLALAAAPADCGAVVKADAYGLGMARVARRLHREGCRHFFVATGSEGAALRALLGDVEIFVFEGALEGDVDEFAAAELTPVINTIGQLAPWRNRGRRVALHIDTGMNRMGLSAAEVDELASAPQVFAGMELGYVMTHFACADEPSHPLNAAQLRRFDTLRSRLPSAPTSIGNSAAALLGPPYSGDLARPGIALYGGNPFTSRENPMETVATVKARVLQVRELTELGTVGYGASFAAGPGTRVAVIGTGYADGYPRCLSNRGVVLAAGHRVPVVGRVSMDVTCIDVSAVPADEIGEGALVTLIGEGIPLEEVAGAAGTINYELLTALGPRLERVYLEAESK